LNRSDQRRPVDVQDHVRVLDLLARYCHAIDHHDWDDLRNCFTPDAVLVYGQYNGGRDGFIEYTSAGLSAMIRHSHQLGQTYMQMEDDCQAIRAETYATCFHRYRNDSGATQDLVVGARYIDVIGRDVQVGCQIRSRVMVYDWTRIDVVAGELEDPTLVLGVNGAGDPWTGGDLVTFERGVSAERH
jgi:3-phenylpropionate/cinnamic acid dioxygenase small subunit